MLVVKQGYAHKVDALNCQDAAAICCLDTIRIVCDGCSEGKHSEVGAKLFTKILSNTVEELMRDNISIAIPILMRNTLDRIVNLLGTNPATLKDYLSFTTLVADKDIAYVCGDGYLIIQKGNDIIFEKIDCGEYPKYLVYNYINRNYLKAYKEGVEIDTYDRSGPDVQKVGVASDGIRFVVDLREDSPTRKEFIEILKSGKDLKMKLFINRNEKLFQDDVSIAF